MHDNLLVLAVVLFVSMGVPLGILIGSRKPTGLLGAPLPDSEVQRRGQLFEKIRPIAKISLLVLAVAFTAIACLAIITS